MKPTAPENFDGDAATDRLDPTWKAQVDLSLLDRPNSQVYLQPPAQSVRIFSNAVAGGGCQAQGNGKKSNLCPLP